MGRMLCGTVVDQRARGPLRIQSGAEHQHGDPTAVARPQREKLLRGPSSALFGSRLREEEPGQANFGPDIVLEPAHSVEIVEDIAADGKILGNRYLKLEMAAPEIIPAQGQVGQRLHERQSRHRKFSICRHLLPAPGLLDAESNEQKRLRFEAQKGSEIVRGTSLP